MQTCNLPWQLEWKLKYNNKKKLFNYSTTQYIIQHGNEPIWLYMLQNCNTNAMHCSIKTDTASLTNSGKTILPCWPGLVRCEVKRQNFNSIKLLWVVKVAMSICFENKGGCTYWHNTIVSVSLGGIEKVHKILKLRTFTKKVLELRIVREQAGRVWRQWNDNWFTSPEPSPPHCHVLLMLGPWGVVSILARGNIKHPQGVVSTWTWR